MRRRACRTGNGGREGGIDDDRSAIGGWGSADVTAVDEILSRRALSPCCEAAMRRVETAVELADDVALPESFATDLAHHVGVEVALVEVFATNSPTRSVAEVGQRLMREGHERVGHHLLAVDALERGHGLDALHHAEAACAAQDGRTGGPSDALLARLLADAGDVQGAIERWRLATWAPERDDELDDLEGLVAPIRRVGRNDPCPCASGRKRKRCCAHRIVLPRDVRRRLAVHQLVLAIRVEHADDVHHLAEQAAVTDHDRAGARRPVEGPALADAARTWEDEALLLDVMLSEVGLGVTYLHQRRELLDDDTRWWLRSVAEAQRSVHTVRRTDDGIIATDMLNGDERLLVGHDPIEPLPVETGWTGARDRAALRFDEIGIDASFVFGRVTTEIDRTGATPPSTTMLLRGRFIGPAYVVPVEELVDALDAAATRSAGRSLGWWFGRGEPYRFVDDRGLPLPLVEARFVATPGRGTDLAVAHCPGTRGRDDDLDDDLDEDRSIDDVLDDLECWLDDWFVSDGVGRWVHAIDLDDDTCYVVERFRLDGDVLVVSSPGIETARRYARDLGDLGLRYLDARPSPELEAFRRRATGQRDALPRTTGQRDHVHDADPVNDADDADDAA